MAASLPDRLLLPLPALALLLLAAPWHRLPAAEPAALPAPAIDVVSDSFHIDYQSNTLRLPNVEIRQGDMLIRASEAVARGVELSFANSQWEFRGAVHIEFAGGDLDADRATAEFAGNRLQLARVTGAPARFSHQIKDAASRSQGRADTIEYDVPKGRIRLAGKAWYSDGRNEVVTHALVYSLINRSVENERGEGEDSRVRLTIRPDTPAP